MAATALLCQMAFSQTSGTVKHNTVLVPNKILEIDVSGVATSASWTVGAIVDQLTDAKINVVKADIQKTTPLRKMTGFAELPSSATTIRPGYFGVTLPSVTAPSVGVFARVPAGTEVKISINGKLFTSSSLTSSILVQDGAIRHDSLRSFHQFVLTLMSPEMGEQAEISQAQGRFYVSVSAARAHLMSFTKPPASPAGCCGSQVVVTLDVSINEFGAVTNIVRVAGKTQSVGSIDAIIGSWKFEPFSVAGKPVAVHLLVPLIFVDNAVKSPLF